MLVIALVGMAWWFRDKAPSPDPSPPCCDGAPVPVPVEGPAVEVLSGSEFDRNYAVAGGDIERDLGLVHGILEDAELLVKDFGRHPLADNRDFVRFLSGRNPHRVAWIRPGHPSVNAAGELVDRWGSPLFFHRESATSTTLRSAGPDRRLWTADDVEMTGEQFQARR